MKKTYRVTKRARFINGLTRMLIRLGLAPKGMALLTVQGRKSGRAYSTPVRLVEDDERLWLVSPYGEVNWLKNARAAGRVTVKLRGQVKTFTLREAGPVESAAVLKKYLQLEPITQPYFDALPDSPPEAFAAEASRHPVFLLQREPKTHH